MMKIIRGILCVALQFSAAGAALAAHGNYAEAMRVRALIKTDDGDYAGRIADRVVLPVSRGYNQGGTELCWAYATLNALETNWLVRHPEDKVELSRRTMQVFTMRDRYARKIRGTATYIGERGIAVDAMQLLTDNGLVAFADFKDIEDPYGRYDISGAIARASGEAAKIAAMEEGVSVVYGVPPTDTHLDDRPVTRAELTTALVDGKTWESYAIARDGRTGYRRHPDPDSRAGAQSWFMPESEFPARIKAALTAGYAVEITIGGHCILIYGASYDEDGKPVTYYIKDSYPDYFYTASPSRIMSNLVEMTTVRLDADERAGLAAKDQG